MKKRDIFLAGVILVLALVIWLCTRIFSPEEYQKIRITVNGEVYGEYSLGEDQEIAIGDTNVCRIEDGKVKMTEASCPDHLCMEQHAVDSSGGTIICLPNKVVIEALGGTDSSQSEIDGFAG